MGVAELHRTGQQTKQNKTRLDQNRQQLAQKQAAKWATVTHPHTKSSTHIRVSGKEKKKGPPPTPQQLALVYVCLHFQRTCLERYPEPSALDQIDQILAAVDKSRAPAKC